MLQALPEVAVVAASFVSELDSNVAMWNQLGYVPHCKTNSEHTRQSGPIALQIPAASERNDKRERLKKL